MINHIHLPHNNIGDDFIIGDLHGNLQPLIKLLDYIQFDKQTDRLFSVGDTIDRGPQSIECANLIYEPWFFPIIGNHELMMIQSILYNNETSLETWLYNGGEWHLSITNEELMELANSWLSQPLIYSIGNDNNRFNIVHAELYSNNNIINNSHIDNWSFDNSTIDNILWGRNIANLHSYPNHNNPQLHSKDLSLTFVGHTIFHNITQIQQHIYLDTGIFLNKTLSCFSPTQHRIYQYTPLNNSFITSNPNNITKINIPK